MKQIILFLLVLVGIWFVRRKLTGGQAASGAQPEAPAAPREVEAMQACAQCGVHVPQSEGILAGGHFYCSEAHRQMGPRS